MSIGKKDIDLSLFSEENLKLHDIKEIILDHEEINHKRYLEAMTEIESKFNKLESRFDKFETRLWQIAFMNMSYILGFILTKVSGIG
jgi:hypothetical protein